MLRKTTTTTREADEDLITVTKRDLDDARARGDDLSTELLEDALNDLLDGYPHSVQM